MITLLAMVWASTAGSAAGPPGPGESKAGHFAMIGDLRIYHEIHGSGRPIVLPHGGGSTIQSTFGRILPALATSRQVIAVELQAHGHTLDIDRPLSFEQDADDVDALLTQLHIDKADFMGFSNGGTTCLQIAIRHPQRVRKLVLASTTYRRDGMQPGFFEGMNNVTFESMPAPLKEAHLKANPDPQGLRKMFDRDVARMVSFKDIDEARLGTIQAPALVLNGDQEVVRAEHALQLSRTLPHAQLAILPGDHGAYLGELTTLGSHSKLPELTVALIEEFLQ